jgi:hypothetical protein
MGVREGASLKKGCICGNGKVHSSIMALSDILGLLRAREGGGSPAATELSSVISSCLPTYQPVTLRKAIDYIGCGGIFRGPSPKSDLNSTLGMEERVGNTRRPVIER